MFFNSVSPVKLTSETPLVTKCVQKNGTAKIKQIKRCSKRTKRSDALNARCLKFILKERRKSVFGSFIATTFLLCSPSLFLPSIIYYHSHYGFTGVITHVGSWLNKLIGLVMIRRWSLITDFG